MMGYGTGGSGYGSMMGNGSGGTGYSWMMGTGMIWMVIWSLLVIAGLVILTFVIVKLARGDSSQIRATHQVADTARLILDERFARGEIDQDDYRKRRESLQ